VVTAAPQSDLFRLFFLKLKDSLAIVKTAVNSLEVLTGAKGLIFKDKINSVVAKNPGLANLLQVNGVLQGEIVDLPSNMSPGEAAELRYCPIVSVDVLNAASPLTNMCFLTEEQVSQKSIWKKLWSLTRFMLARR
jgi:hypothetical protein